MQNGAICLLLQLLSAPALGNLARAGSQRQGWVLSGSCRMEIASPQPSPAPSHPSCSSSPLCFTTLSLCQGILVLHFRWTQLSGVFTGRLHRKEALLKGSKLILTPSVWVLERNLPAAASKGNLRQEPPWVPWDEDGWCRKGAGPLCLIPSRCFGSSAWPSLLPPHSKTGNERLLSWGGDKHNPLLVHPEIISLRKQRGEGKSKVGTAQPCKAGGWGGLRWSSAGALGSSRMFPAS